MPSGFPSQAVVSTENIPCLSLHLSITVSRSIAQQRQEIDSDNSHPKEACHRPATNRAVGYGFILELAFPLIHLEQLARRKLYPAGTPVQLAPPTIIVFLDTGRQLRGVKGGTRRRHLFDSVMEAALGSSILSEMGGESFAEVRIKIASVIHHPSTRSTQNHPSQ